jgi:methylmalonyl-CoA mutase C-terminal domain/subunit
MDAHWRGAIVVAHALRDAGMEVVYIGNASAAEIVVAVVEEDAVLLGLSSLCGNHLAECAAVLQSLRETGSDDVAVVLGGAIPPGDLVALREMGIDAVFGTGTPPKVILDKIRELVAIQEVKRQS